MRNLKIFILLIIVLGSSSLSISDEKADAWVTANSWFGSEEEMTAFAMETHGKLVSGGVDTTSDEYYSQIDQAMREAYRPYFLWELSVLVGAEAGIAKYQWMAGHSYQGGEQAVEKNSAKAVFWYEKAAEQGYADAYFALGAMYLQGNGVLEDYLKAATWFDMAARQGAHRGQLQRGLMFAQGKGSPQNLSLAYMWVLLAKLNENESAAEALKALKTLMTSQQISKGQSLAKLCNESNYQNCGY